MVWGMIMPNGLVAIKIMEGRQNSEKYIELLRTFAVPIINLNYKNPYHFIQGNCMIRVSPKTKNYRQTQMFNVVKWPARSPDINLMENVWKLISDLVYMDEQPENKKDLEYKINAAVLKINTEKLKITSGLFSNYRERLTNVLISKGNISK